MAEQWIPHQPKTWPFVFAALNNELVMHDWLDRRRDERGNPVMLPRVVPAGTMVKIVMVSRFGDVGITTDLDAVNGYQARVRLSDLTPTRQTTP